MVMIKTRGKSKNSKIIASVITMSIITMLIVASPAYAWQVSLQPYDDILPVQGKIINAKFNLKLQDEINLAFDKIVVSLDGPESTNCFFDIHGNSLGGNNGGGNPGNPTINVTYSKANPISPLNESKLKLVPINPGNETLNEICKHLSIKPIPLEDYGYGYGYGYGYEHFSYKGNETTLMVSGNMPYLLTINTSVLDLGEYKSKITLMLDNKNKKSYESERQSFTVISGLKKDDNGNDPKSTGGRWRHNETQNESNSVPLSDNSTILGDNTNTPPAAPQPSFFSRITGAVIGTLGKTGTAIIGIVILALVASTAALQARRRFFVTGTSAAGASAAASTSSSNAAKIAAQ